MTRSRRRHPADALGEKIARRGMTADLNKALSELSGTSWNLLRQLLEHEEPIEHLSPWLARVRHDPELLELLSTYFDGWKPRLKGRCFTCTQQLPPRAPGAPGRPAEYCGSVCRQQAYRDRNRKSERYQEMLRATKLAAAQRRYPGIVFYTAAEWEAVSPSRRRFRSGREERQWREREQRRVPIRAKKLAEKQNRLPPNGS